MANVNVKDAASASKYLAATGAGSDVDPYVPGHSLATLIAGEDIANDVQKVEQRFTYKYITAAAPTTTVVKAGAGFLHSITINKPIAAGVISVYDHPSAANNPFALVTHPATLLGNPYTLTYDVVFANGLTIVTSGAAQDITVSYR